jgi:hypothetical protein
MSQDPYWDWIQWHLSLSSTDQRLVELVAEQLTQLQDEQPLQEQQLEHQEQLEPPQPPQQP